MQSDLSLNNEKGIGLLKLLQTYRFDPKERVFYAARRISIALNLYEKARQNSKS